MTQALLPYQASGSVHAGLGFTLVRFHLTVDPCVPSRTEAAVAQCHVVTCAVVLARCRQAVVHVRFTHVAEPPFRARTRVAVGTGVTHDGYD